MCNAQCLDFIRISTTPSDVEGQRVLEVGALDVNGSPRAFLEELKPASYLGIDLVEGPGVDKICPAETLVDAFGPEAFDLVVSTEMIEHVRDWRLVLSNLKRVLAPNGLLLLTTRSLGFPQHDYPFDYWRFEQSDMLTIFRDFEIARLERDEPESPGVFVAARRPKIFEELDLDAYALHSMICGHRVATVEDAEAFQTLASQERTVRSELTDALELIHELGSQLEVSRAGKRQLEERLIALESTKTFRYSAGVRKIYERIRSVQSQNRNASS